MPGHVNLVHTRSFQRGLNKYNIPFEPSILHFQGRHLVIDWRKVKRYGYYRAEGHRGAEGDSWEGLPHNSDPGQIVHFQQRWHLKKSNP